jgi:hypothetical protein
MVVVVCFLFLHTSYTRNRGGGMCYTTKCYTVEDSLTECALEGKVAGYDRVVRSPIRKGSGKEVG